jgi:hypothetical protein
VRLWTLHPKYLDAPGLVALWREALLARAVLRGRTVGYRHHPQLHRFRACGSPCHAINAYLACIAEEAAKRGYSFDRTKIGPVRRDIRLTGTAGQLDYEWERLLRKLKARNPRRYRECLRAAPEPHPIFRIRPGEVEPWER